MIQKRRMIHLHTIFLIIMGHITNGHVTNSCMVKMKTIKSFRLSELTSQVSCFRPLGYDRDIYIGT